MEHGARVHVLERRGELRRPAHHATAREGRACMLPAATRLHADLARERVARGMLRDDVQCVAHLKGAQVRDDVGMRHLVQHADLALELLQLRRTATVYAHSLAHDALPSPRVAEQHRAALVAVADLPDLLERRVSIVGLEPGDYARRPGFSLIASRPRSAGCHQLGRPFASLGGLQPRFLSKE